ncbi:MAG TPA: CPBP family intramembrane glutamic endopeptidase [Candidatus Acidoferrum sp.]|nr:CPBP family intramembrane glutamic endopeptidase [Candidatus Acidoferrum sp.]
MPLIVAANFFVGRPWGVGAAAILGGFTNAGIGIFAIADLAGAQVWAPPGVSAADRFGYDAGTIVSVVAASGFLFRQIRKEVSAIVPIDPDHPVHLVALVLATLLLGIDIAAIAFAEVLSNANSQPALTVLDLFENELPFLVIAAAGVGILIRRNLVASVQRLGLVIPAWWHVVLAVAAAGALYAVGQGMDLLSHQLTPGVAHSVDATTQHVFGQLDNPVGIAALAILPGLSEDILFRGAIQPRLGLIVTAVLFTSLHTEYGLSMDTLAVFIAALGLGLIRKYANTTASVTCHTVYNLLAGIGIAGMALNAAIVIEVLLVVVSVYAIWTRRQAPATSSP